MVRGNIKTKSAPQHASSAQPGGPPLLLHAQQSITADGALLGSTLVATLSRTRYTRAAATAPRVLWDDTVHRQLQELVGNAPLGTIKTDVEPATVSHVMLVISWTTRGHPV